MAEPETSMEKFWRKAAKDPIVPIGAAVTAGILLAGLRAFNRGDKQRSQQLMRYRVLAQGITIAGMMVGIVGLHNRKASEPPAAPPTNSPY